MASRLETLTRQFKKETDRQKKDMLRFQVQGEVTRVLASTMDSYSDCLDQIVETVGVIMGADRVSLMVKKGNFLHIAASVGIPQEILQKGNLVRIGQGIAGTVAQTGEPVITGDLRKDDDFKEQAVGGTQYTSHAFVCLPLKSSDEVVGVINVSNPTEGKSFKVADFNFLKKTADLIGVMLHKSLQFEAMRQKSGVTGRVSLPGPTSSSGAGSARGGRIPSLGSSGVGMPAPRPKRLPFQQELPAPKPKAAPPPPPPGGRKRAATESINIEDIMEISGADSEDDDSKES